MGRRNRAHGAPGALVLWIAAALLCLVVVWFELPILVATYDLGE